MTWDRFCFGLVGHARSNVRRKESLPGWAPSTFADQYRSKGSVQRAYAIGIDVDGHATLDAAARLWRGTLGCAHTTHSHDPAAGKLRLRLVLLLSRPITAAQHARIWAWAAARCARAGWIVDMGACDASRYFYRPASAPGRTVEWHRWGKRPIDVDHLLATLPPPKPTQPSEAKPRKVNGAARARPPTVVAPSAARDSFFGRAFAAAGPVNDLASGALAVVCPWIGEHESGRRLDGSTVVMPPREPGGWGTFHCSHDHCKGRKALDTLPKLPPAALAEARAKSGGVGMTIATITRARLDERPDAGPEWPLFRRLRLDLALECTGEIITGHETVVPTYGRHAHAGIRKHYENVFPDIDPALITRATWMSPHKGYRITGRRLIVSLRGGFVQWMRACTSASHRATPMRGV